MTIKDKVGIIRRTAGNSAVLNTVSGTPPLTLTKTLEKKPKRITVYGNTGGVGDRANQLDPARSNDVQRVSSYNIGRIRLRLTANTKYTLWSDYPQNTITGVMAAAMINNSSGSATSANNGAWLGKTRTVTTTDEGELWIYSGGTFDSNNQLVGDTNMTKALDLGYRFMLAEGEYEYADFPKYVPYGVYVIPVSIGSKSVIIYVDNKLVNSYVSISPTQKKAMRGNTEISSLQDWTMQDWTIPKADSLTVDVGTSVTPSNVIIQYYSK